MWSFTGNVYGVSGAISMAMQTKIHCSKVNFFPFSSVEMSPGDEILTLLQTTTFDVKEFEREASCLPAEDGEQGDGGWIPITNSYLWWGRDNCTISLPASVVSCGC